METTLQLRTNNKGSELPAVRTAQDLVDIRKRYPGYRLLPQPARLEWLASEALVLASVTRLRDFGGKDAAALAAALDEALMEDGATASLTLPELHDAFRAGIFGRFGEYYGMSAPSLYGFARKYLDSEKKRDASEIESETAAKTYAEKRRAEREKEQRKIRAEIEKAKRDGTFTPTGRAWFQPKKVKDVTDDAEHRERVLRQAREILSGDGAD